MIGDTLTLRSQVKEIFGSSFSENIFISKINKISISNVEVPLNGYEINNNNFDLLYSKSNTSLSNFQATANFPSTTAGSIIEIDLFLTNPSAQEELYFYRSETRFTKFMYCKINK